MNSADFDRGFNTDWSDPWQAEMADRHHAYGQPASQLPPAREHCPRHGEWTPRGIATECPHCLDDDDHTRAQAAAWADL